MYYTFRNNLKTTLISDITATDTTISFKHLVNSTNAQTRLEAWPETVANTASFTLTLINTTTKSLEIINCLSVASNTEEAISFVCARGHENTTAQAFTAAACSVEHRTTADWFLNFTPADDFTALSDTVTTTTTTANSALTIANSAKTTADTATTLATNAGTAAGTAQTTANAAQSTATTAKSTADAINTNLNNLIKTNPTTNAIPMTSSTSNKLDSWVSKATDEQLGLVYVGAGLAIAADGELTNDAPATAGFGLLKDEQGLHVTRAPRIGKPSILIPKANAILPKTTLYRVSKTPIDEVTYDWEYPLTMTQTGVGYELLVGDNELSSSSSTVSSGSGDSTLISMAPGFMISNEYKSYAVTDIAAVDTTRFGVQYFENTDTSDIYLLTNYAGIFKTADYGATWTVVSPLLQSSVLTNIAYGNGRYVCTRGTGPYWSTDLITWNAGTAYPATYNSTNVLYVSDIGKFVVIAKAITSSGATSYDMIKTSDDGATWTTLWTSSVSGAACGTIAYANGAFIVGTMAGGVFKVDAFTGAVSGAVTISSGGGIVRVVADMKQSRFVAGVSGNGKTAYSTDGLNGTTWSTATTTPLASIGDVITDGNGYTYIRSNYASNAIYVSHDMATWTALPMQGVTAAIKAFYAKLGFLSFAIPNSATYSIRNISIPYYLRLRVRSSDAGDSEWSDIVPIYFAQPCSWSV